MDVKLKHLLTLKKVCDLKSFSGAARELGISQPAVSSQVKSLEEDVGQVLIDRSGDELQPTAAGRVVIQAAGEMARIWSRAELELERLTPSQGSLRIAASTVPSEFIVPGLVHRFSQQHPGVKVSIQVSDSREALRLYDEGEVDVAVVGCLESSRPATCLARDELVIIAPRDHPLAAAGQVQLAEVTRYPFILREKGSGTRTVFMRYLRERGIDPQELTVAATYGSTESVVKAVTAGTGVSMVSKLAAQPAAQAGQVVVVDLAGPALNRDICVLCRQDDAAGQAGRDFARMVAELSGADHLGANHGDGADHPGTRGGMEI